MDEIKFKSLEELYKKLLPALTTKVADLKRSDLVHIKEEDIWDYLRKYYWYKKTDLTLGEMVNDILSTPNEILIKYKEMKTNNNIKDDNLL